MKYAFAYEIFGLRQMCYVCRKMHGKILLIDEKPAMEPPVHPRCRCDIRAMKTVEAGTATINGENGADYTLKNDGKLPENYITKNDLKVLGWKRGKYISNYATGKLLTKGVYRNANGHLPQDSKRI